MWESEVVVQVDDIVAECEAVDSVSKLWRKTN